MPGSLSRRESRRIAAVLALACLAIGLVWTLESASAVVRWTEERVHDPWQERGAFTYHPLLADGSGTLAMGEPGYFTSDAPTVRARFSWRLQDPSAERVSAAGAMRVVVSSPSSPGKPAWEHVEPLADATLAGKPTDALELEGVLDLVGLGERLAPRGLEDATWTVVADVRFASAPSSHHAAERSSFTLPLTYAPPLYTLPPPPALGTAKDHAVREDVVHEEARGLAGLRDRPLAPALLLVGLAAVVATRHVRIEEASA